MIGIGERNEVALNEYDGCATDEEHDLFSRVKIDALRQRARDLDLTISEVCIVCLDPFVNRDHSDC